jgi:hypothetical protein
MKQSFWLVAVAVSLPFLTVAAGEAIAQSVGTTKCSGIRGANANTRPIQKATIEPMGKGYVLRFTEINQGKSIETVWKLDKGLVIESARTGTAPEDNWNLVPYNRQPPVKIESTGTFIINMMVSSRSACTFTGKLQFLSNAQEQLFPRSPSTR